LLSSFFFLWLVVQQKTRSKTKQNKTKQNKTKQNKTKQRPKQKQSKNYFLAFNYNSMMRSDTMKVTTFIRLLSEI
jgi:hypothetical protein